MGKKSISRRSFLKATSAGLAGAAAMTSLGGKSVYCNVGKSSVPALLGGTPVRTKPFPSWPVYDNTDVQMLLDAYHSKHWCRVGGGTRVAEFEKKYAELLEVPYCVATSSGTTALNTSLNVLGVGPGDEVIIPPYTFVATAQVVFHMFALAVFVDIDPETHQINPELIEERITEHTRAIMPVHIAGGAADMDRILAIARKHNLPVIEDACQAWMSEWNGKKLGSIGTLGCFSFQATKNLNSGEGGAIIGSDRTLMDLCASYMNNGRPFGERKSTLSGYPNSGSNHRMTEFQGAILLGQIRRLEEQTALRGENAAYLDKLLDQIPGISPAKKYPGQTRHTYHLYMMNYDKSRFSGLSRDKFVRALEAEGIETISKGYGAPLNKAEFIEGRLDSRSYKTIYSPERLAKYRRENHCPENDRVCQETGLWLFQSVFLGTKKDMEDIAEAIAKIQKSAAKLL